MLNAIRMNLKKRKMNNHCPTKLIERLTYTLKQELANSSLPTHLELPMVRRAYIVFIRGGGHADVIVTVPGRTWSPPFLRRKRPSKFIIKRSASELKREGIKQEGRELIPNPARLLELLMSWPELAKQIIFELEKQKKQAAKKKEEAAKKEAAKKKEEAAKKKRQAYHKKRMHWVEKSIEKMRKKARG